MGRLKRDLAALQTPLPVPYDACEKVSTTVSSLSLVRYRLNDYSVSIPNRRAAARSLRPSMRTACRTFK